MKRTTDLVAEPGERVEVRDIETGQWIVGEVARVEVIHYVWIDDTRFGGHKRIAVEAEDIRKPQSVGE